jgi:hypothetical protein
VKYSRGVSHARIELISNISESISASFIRVDIKTASEESHYSKESVN